MSEETWVSEARIVRGLRRPDPLKKVAQSWWERYNGWRPSTDSYVKIVATAAIVSLVVYAWAAAKSDTVSHG